MKYILILTLISIGIDSSKYLHGRKVQKVVVDKDYFGFSVFALKCYDCKNDDCSELKEVECGTGEPGCAFQMENCKSFSRNYIRLISGLFSKNSIFIFSQIDQRGLYWEKYLRWNKCRRIKM